MKKSMMDRLQADGLTEPNYIPTTRGQFRMTDIHVRPFKIATL